MQKYLDIIQSYPNSATLALAVALGVFVLAVLTIGFLSVGHQAKIKRLKAEQQDLIQSNALQHAQLTDQLTQAQALQSEMAEKTEQLTVEKQKLVSESQRATGLEAELEQLNQESAELNQQLEAQKQLIQDLQQEKAQQQNLLVEKDEELERSSAVIAEQAKQLLAADPLLQQTLDKTEHELQQLASKYAAYKAYFDKLTLNRIQVFAELNDVKRQLSVSERALTLAQQTTRQLQNKHKAYKAYFGKLAFNRIPVFTELNKTVHQLNVLEAQLAASATKPAESATIAIDDSVQSSENLAASAVQESVDVKPANPLARWMKAVKPELGSDKTETIETEPVKVAQPEPAPVIEHTHYQAEIAKLTDEIAAQQRHINRLQDLLNERGEQQKPVAEQVLQPTVKPESSAEPTVAPVATPHLPNDIKQQWQSLVKKVSAIKPPMPVVQPEVSEPEPVVVAEKVSTKSIKDFVDKIKHFKP
ncbi:hypothetical protein [Methylocucumis oryzae]|uniref:Uncharacterized protein n=1 Tax=Methylocucumis oryzae TaxID=1632867 RepID=A0A0F3ILE2_9GAMM|nr:hypothetical protein [Methylocucumis oryzae]KJV07482.1 hypothetical protein VZ94_04440 [Methylocucumis oryzae]